MEVSSPHMLVTIAHLLGMCACLVLFVSCCCTIYVAQSTLQKEVQMIKLRLFIEYVILIRIYAASTSMLRQSKVDSTGPFSKHLDKIFIGLAAPPQALSINICFEHSWIQLPRRKSLRRHIEFWAGRGDLKFCFGKLFESPSSPWRAEERGWGRQGKGLSFSPRPIFPLSPLSILHFPTVFHAVGWDLDGGGVRFLRNEKARQGVDFP